MTEELYGSNNDRHTAIYKRYLQNPRFLSMEDNKNFYRITTAQQVTMGMTLAGALIPAWALSTSKRFRRTNTKTWCALLTAHIGIIGLNSYFNNRFRSFLHYVDDKYFLKQNLAQLQTA